METKSALVSLVFTFIGALNDGDKTFGPRSSSTAIRKMIFTVLIHGRMGLGS